METDCAGFVPHVTVGRSVAASSTTSWSNVGVVVGDERAPVVERLLPRRARRRVLATLEVGERRVVGSDHPRPRPASIDMLQTVMRPSMESARIAEPRYSMIEPMPPAVPMRLMIASTMSLAVTPAGSSPSTVTAIVPGRGLRQRLRGEHVLDLAGADAEGQRAERAVGRRVAVAAHDRQPGLREALLGTDHVHDALAGLAHRVQPDAELRAVVREHLHLLRRDRVGDRLVDVGGRDVVVHRGDGEVGSAHGAAGEAQPVERLR